MYSMSANVLSGCTGKGPCNRRSKLICTTMKTCVAALHAPARKVPLQAHTKLERGAQAELASGQGWLLRARAGLGQLLRARVAPAQRQAILQLCARVADVGGTQWLLTSSRYMVSIHPLVYLLHVTYSRLQWTMQGLEQRARAITFVNSKACMLLSGVASNRNCSSSHITAIEQGELPENFYQLLVESMKVETLVGLRDAMAPDEAVPLPGQSSGPAEATPPDNDASSSRAEDACEPDKATEAHPGRFICRHCL